MIRLIEKHYLLSGFVLFVLLSVSIDSEALTFNYLESVTNGTEHWNEKRTPYNEDNDGRLYEIRADLVRDSNFPSISRHMRYTSGHFINSHYDGTDFIGLAGEACTESVVSYCWAFGVGGFRGYENTPDMLDGYAFAPLADHSIQINAKGFKATYRQYWLVNAVSSEYWGIGYQFEF